MSRVASFAKATVAEEHVDHVDVGRVLTQRRRGAKDAEKLRFENLSRVEHVERVEVGVGSL